MNVNQKDILNHNKNLINNTEEPMANESEFTNQAKLMQSTTLAFQDIKPELE